MYIDASGNMYTKIYIIDPTGFLIMRELSSDTKYVLDYIKSKDGLSQLRKEYINHLRSLGSLALYYSEDNGIEYFFLCEPATTHPMGIFIMELQPYEIQYLNQIDDLCKKTLTVIEEKVGFSKKISSSRCKYVEPQEILEVHRINLDDLKKNYFGSINTAAWVEIKKNLKSQVQRKTREIPYCQVSQEYVEIDIKQEVIDSTTYVVTRFVCPNCSQDFIAETLGNLR
jgi:hypothetical protein